ncbi:MAG: hypothetical protein IT331_07370 [Anaerolineae bacterium]|nr:hypothetical protein [Anaerolineae bacterium]
MNIFERMTNRVFGSRIQALVSARVNLAVAARDDLRDRQWGANPTRQDRYAWKRADVLRDAFTAWRENPLARRIVGLTSQYVVGGGLAVSSDDAATNDFLQEWWTHRLNRMTIRAFEWCDELTRAGELFVVISTDAGGMSYVRAIPASEIQEIETAPNDIEQEQAFIQKPQAGDRDPTRWHAYDELSDGSANLPIGGSDGSANLPIGGSDGSANLPIGGPGLGDVMLHYAINRPVGAKFGESDLAPLLKWLARYGAWLEDRARLNKYRQTFLYWVKKPFRDSAERLARQSELNANPPNPGTIFVTNDDEEWSVIHPKLDSFEAGEDGLAMKKTIAAGAGVPLHFLAEPESSTRTTAEQAGGPTFRHFEQRQIFFLWMLTDLARIVVRRAAAAGRQGISVDSDLKARGTDIFSRDNANLAASASAIIEGFGMLRDRGLIDDAEYVRLAYRFAGEVVDVAKILADGKKAGATTTGKKIGKIGADSAATVPTAGEIARRDG